MGYNFVAISAWVNGNHDAIEALAAIGGLIFSIILTGSTVLLWKETRRLALGAETQSRDMRDAIKEASRSADAMERTEIATSKQTAILHQTLAETQAANVTLNRAYAYIVLISHNCIEYLSGNHNVLNFEWQFKNFGSTPAHFISSVAEIQIEPAFFPVIVSDQRFFGKVIAGHNESTDPRITTYSAGALHADKVSAVLAGTQTIFFFGGAIYVDVFGNSRLTNFGFAFDTQSNIFTEIPGQNYRT